MTKVTLSFDLESIYPRPELMPPDGKETIRLYLTRQIPQYEAEKRLGWTRSKFNYYLATLVSVADRKLENVI